MRFLRTNTAVIITVGPFYDKTDGVTIETGLTITNERITLTADTDDGSAPTNILDNVTGATSGTANDLNYITGNDAGMMQLELSAANVNRLGRMFLSITDAANHVPVFHEFMVLPAMIYDAFVSGTDTLDASITQLLGTAIATPTVGGVMEVDLTHVAGSTTNVSTLATDVQAIITDTADMQPKLGTPAGASISADIAAIEAQTDDIGAAGAGLTAIPWNAAWDAEAQSEVADALAVYGPPTRAEATADKAEILAVLQGLVLEAGTIGDTSNDTTHLHLEGLTYGDDEINNYLLVIFDVSEAEYHSRWIEDWVAATDLATVATLPFTPANDTDTYWLLPVRQDVTGGSGLDAAGVRAAIGMASANLDTQLTNIDNFIDTEITDIQSRLPAALVSGRMDSSVGAMAANVMTAAAAAADLTTELQSGLATAAALDAVDNFLDTEIAAIKAVTDLLPDAGALTSLATQASVNTIDDFLDTEIAAIKAKTDNLPADPADASDVAAAITAAQNAITDILNVTTRNDPSALAAELAAGLTPLMKLDWILAAVMRDGTFNKTTGVHIIKNQGGTDIAKATASDDGTTTQRGEFGAP